MIFLSFLMSPKSSDNHSFLVQKIEIWGTQALFIENYTVFKILKGKKAYLKGKKNIFRTAVVLEGVVLRERSKILVFLTVAEKSPSAISPLSFSTGT